jgi:TetR/AcrR family acrAB operon transcriptional repressor
VATRRQQTSGQSRELILDAAAELFAQKGYRQTTFVDVAERSGISRGSIPWHFGSKEGLLLAVLERSAAAFRAGLTAGPDPAGDLAADFDRVSQGLRTLFSLPTTRLFATLLVEALEPASPLRDRYAEIHEALREHCASWLARLPLPPGLSAEALAVTLMGAGIGIHQQWLLAPDRIDPEQALTVLRGLVAAAVQLGGSASGERERGAG